MNDNPALSDFLAGAWDLLIRGVHDKRAPARHPTIATVAGDGRPEMRTVVLRGADRAAATVECHSDTRTAKVCALRDNPHAALHVWSARHHLQLRLALRVEILTGDTVADRWEKVPPAARVAYGTDPAPGSPIDKSLAYEKPADPARFAVLLGHVTEMDVLHLGDDHRRALFAAQTQWRGTWLAP